tara:strand:+ start:1380 stop:1790 length:411 start_codon:yes stop_codon:yes gene_type:complete
LNTLEKADRLLELWVRELDRESSNPYKASSMLDGNFALGEGGKRNPLKNYISAKETRSPPRDVVNSDLILIDKIVSNIGKVNSKYPDVLRAYYKTGSLKRVAKEIHTSVTKARELKAAAFDMVVALLDYQGEQKWK